MSFQGILGGLIIIGSILVANLLETNEKTDQAAKTSDKGYIDKNLSDTNQDYPAIEEA